MWGGVEWGIGAVPPWKWRESLIGVGPFWERLLSCCLSFLPSLSQFPRLGYAPIQSTLRHCGKLRFQEFGVRQRTGRGKREGTGPPPPFCLCMPSLRNLRGGTLLRRSLPHSCHLPPPLLNYPFEAITLNNKKKQTGMQRVGWGGVSEGDCLVRVQPALKARKEVGCVEGVSPPPSETELIIKIKAGPFVLRPSPKSHIAIVQKAILLFFSGVTPCLPSPKQVTASFPPPPPQSRPNLCPKQ